MKTFFHFILASIVILIAVGCSQAIPGVRATGSPPSNQPGAEGQAGGTTFSRPEGGGMAQGRQGGTFAPGKVEGTPMAGRPNITPGSGRQAGTPLPGRPFGVEPTIQVTPAPPPTTIALPFPVPSTSQKSLSPSWVVRQVRSIVFDQPAGLAVGQDGTLWVTNIGNNRIYHLDGSGNSLGWWGGSSVIIDSARPESGLFNEPWAIAIGSDRTLYVADTWNHRVQKFNLDGVVLLDWGLPGLEKRPNQMFTPRGVAVNAQGVVFVSDAGNQRIVAYTSIGKYLGETAGAGSQPGQLDEPAGLWVNEEGKVFVADAWNRRVQVFSFQSDGKFLSEKSWQVDGWTMKSLEYRPYLCGSNGKLYLTDPEQNRVMIYSPQGEKLKVLDLNAAGVYPNGKATGIACDSEGGVWVSLMSANALVYLRPE